MPQTKQYSSFPLCGYLPQERQVVRAGEPPSHRQHTRPGPAFNLVLPFHRLDFGLFRGMLHKHHV